MSTTDPRGAGLLLAGLLMCAAAGGVAATPLANCPASPVYDGFARGDMNMVMAPMAADVEWVHPGVPETIPFAGTFQGHDGVRKFFDTVAAELQPIFQNILFCLSDGDQVAVGGAEAYHVKRTGRRYDTRWIHLYTFRDGKIVRFEEFADTAAIAAAFAK